jgi:hypothetical protein
MENIFNSIAPALLFVSSLLGFGTEPVLVNPSVETDVVQSVEIGLSETSPLGAQGGFAMPASGCGIPHVDGTPINGCTPGTVPVITVDKPLVRYGDTVVVTWATNTYSGCTLSSNVTSLAPPVVVGTGGSRNDVVTGEETYTITCTGGSDSVTVKVLPRIQET